MKYLVSVETSVMNNVSNNRSVDGSTCFSFGGGFHRLLACVFRQTEVGQ